MKELLSTEQREEYLHIRQGWREDLERTDCFARVGPHLTPIQKRLLDFIRAYVKEHEMAPNYTEMGKALGGYSKTGVYRILRCLAKERFIRITPYRPRGIEVLLW